MTSNRSFLTLLTLILSLNLFTTACDLSEETIDDQIGDSTSAVSGRPYFELWKTGSRYYFHLSAENHEIILSSQSYSSRTAALAGILSVLDNAGYAERYDLREAQSGEYYFNLKAANGRVIGTSEMYSTRQNAERGIAAVDNNAGDYVAYLAGRTGARFVVSEGTSGSFYFNLRAANGAVVLQSESYTSEAAAYNGTFSVAANGIDADNYDVRQANNGGYYFNIIASNGQVVGTSEVYSSKYNAERARDSIIALLPNVHLL